MITYPLGIPRHHSQSTLPSTFILLSHFPYRFSPVKAKAFCPSNSSFSSPLTRPFIYERKHHQVHLHLRFQLQLSASTSTKCPQIERRIAHRPRKWIWALPPPAFPTASGLHLSLGVRCLKQFYLATLVYYLDILLPSTSL